MDDFAHNKKATESQTTRRTDKSTGLQPDIHSSSAFNFEEELKRLNINTMLEIYGEEYREKITLLMR